jgi:hypothetical protein
VIRESALSGLFRNPPTEYRSVPFWAWNDRLRLEELERQIRDMHSQGMGGFFMHSRDGLETSYLSREWMDAVRLSADLAGELGMKAWLYDEDRWPSGTAGGEVPAMGDEYRSKGLTLEVRAAGFGYPVDNNVAAVFRARVQERQLVSCTRLEDASALVQNPALEPEEVLLIFRVEVSAKSEWFNGESPPDSMNPDTVRQFIRLTYERYKGELGDRFAERVAGIFTDEPGVHDRHCKYTPGRGWLPWTYGLPAFFIERRGYDMMDVLPYLFYDGELSPMARHDYWRTVTEKFSEAFSRQLGEWCGENGIAFTGHYLWENALGVATRVGGAVMPHYRYQQVPGIDMLCEQTEEHLTVKQCTSVANQYGRKFVISETYGCTGWHFTFEGQKWMGDWQYVLGVNMRSQHLALYSLRGCRKRDYPPVFNYQASWWKYNRLVEDYFARIGAVLSEGRPVRRLLVLHPASTAWSMLGTTPYENIRRGLDADIPVVDRYGDDFNTLLRHLLGAHYDFDLGDETIMEEAGTVENGELRINLAAYNTILLPPIRTMLESTRRLLADFLAAGGRIIAMAPEAAMIEGRPSAAAGELYRHPGVTVVTGLQELTAALEQALPRTVSIRETGGHKEAYELLYLLKETEEGHTLFVVNNDRNRSYQVMIEAAVHGQVEEWDPLTGERRAVEAEAADSGHIRFQAYFGPAGSKLYVITGQGAAAGRVELPPAAQALIAEKRTAASLGPVFAFTRTMPNVLTLDSCSYRIAGGAWSEELQVWQAQRDIRQTLGMRQVYANGITQRYKWIGQYHPANGTEVGLRFAFTVEEVPDAELHLVLEAAERFRIQLNGQEVPGIPEGWFVDRSFTKIRMPRLVQGRNVLELSCAYHADMELEDCYLTGDFAVTPGRSLVNEPETLTLGDWGQQGYLHYNGSMIYRMEFMHSHTTGGLAEERTLLKLGQYEAVTVEVRINGQTAGHVPWRAADGVELTGYLQEGVNYLEVEVMGSPRNMFGPFHQAAGDQPTTSWESFRTEGASFTPDYRTMPYGLMEEVRIVNI